MSPCEFAGGDVSREGVQRDLLPLIEGSTVQTKFGSVKTDHILFIASGAFHLSKPSDLVPELQGRLPIRVELDALKPSDFARILTEPDHSLVTQYQALLKTDGIAIEFAESGIEALAEIAVVVNEKTETYRCTPVTYARRKSVGRLTVSNWPKRSRNSHN